MDIKNRMILAVAVMALCWFGVVPSGWCVETTHTPGPRYYHPSKPGPPTLIECDVAVYGGTPAGVAASIEAAQSRGVPRWLELDAEQKKGKILALPNREDVSLPVQEKMIVELYSK